MAKKNQPIISIIIPTYYKSPGIVEIPLESIKNQTCPKDTYEVILADNLGGIEVKQLAEKYKTKLLSIDGQPSQADRQINLGVKMARGEYVLLVDHDIELDSNLIATFLNSIKKNGEKIDAWYIPYKIIARGNLLTKVRNFEEEFYRDSVIATPRIIKKETFLATEDQFDPLLKLGPADWDLDIQLKRAGARISYLNSYLYHHEESLSFWQILSKKVIYSKGGEVYKQKWLKKDPRVYNNVVKKQYSPFYRLVGIFLEKGKWRKLVKNLHLYILFLVIRVTMASIYLASLI